MFCPGVDSLASASWKTLRQGMLRSPRLPNGNGCLKQGGWHSISDSLLNQSPLTRRQLKASGSRKLALRAISFRVVGKKSRPGGVIAKIDFCLCKFNVLYRRFRVIS